MKTIVKEQTTKPIRSPLFYVGDKYKLMPQLNKLFPKEIEVYIEPFVGGGSSFLNTKAKKYLLNDIDPWIIKIHRELIKYLDNDTELFDKLFSIIDEYGFTCTLRGRDVPEGYRKKYVKTYFARANKESYTRLREDFNSDKSDILKLYTLLIYGFNHMIRFNGNGNFNLPVGNVDFNKNVEAALKNYLKVCSGLQIELANLDYKEFLNNIDFSQESYVYFDPPYLISGSEYNKLWDEKNEIELYETIDKLADKGIKFGITNLLNHKGMHNDILEKWSQKYKVYNINSNYISFNDNTIKNGSKEVFITNYGTE